VNKQAGLEVYVFFRKLTEDMKKYHASSLGATPQTRDQPTQGS
jgi:hypothetical protein